MKPRGRVEEHFDYPMKAIIIGDSGVGKSNILLRYSEGRFVENYMMTIGINYVYKIIEVEGARIKLQIWDTAGQDKYKTITKNYYRNSQGVLVVFGIDSKDSFYSVRNWIEDLSDTLADGTQTMLVGNKTDLGEKREVSREEAEQLASHYGVPYMECSAKSGESINQVFGSLAKMMKERIIDGGAGESGGGGGILPVPSHSGRCCSS